MTKKVEDVGLNGVLVTEQDTTRAFRLYCQPFVNPQTRPIYVIATVEGGTPNGAAPVLLRVEPLASTHPRTVGITGKSGK